MVGAWFQTRPPRNPPLFSLVTIVSEAENPLSKASVLVTIQRRATPDVGISVTCFFHLYSTKNKLGDRHSACPLIFYTLRQKVYLKILRREARNARNPLGLPIQFAVPLFFMLHKINPTLVA